MKQLVILGAGPFASLVRRYAEADLGWSARAFAVDPSYKTADTFEGLQVLTTDALRNAFTAEEVFLFVAVGYRTMRGREAAYQSACTTGYSRANLLCSGSYIGTGVVLGDNNIVMPGAVIEPGARIGANNVIWSNAVVCHDAVLGDHNFIAANVTLGGGVSIGDRNFIGFSAVVLQHRKIGNDTLIGAQTLVNRDTEDFSQYIGSPARRVGAVDAAVGVSVSDD